MWNLVTDVSYKCQMYIMSMKSYILIDDILVCIILYLYHGVWMGDTFIHKIVQSEELEISAKIIYMWSFVCSD